MRPFALHAHTDGGSDREDGLRNIKTTPEGQQPSSSTSATLLPHEHHHLEKCIITVLQRHIGGRWLCLQRALQCRRHGISLQATVCTLPQQVNRLRPRRLHGGFTNLDFSQRDISRDVLTSSRDVLADSRVHSSTQDKHQTHTREWH